VAAWHTARRGASITDALVAALRTKGGELRTSAAVARILVEKQQVVGVQLANGEEVRAAQSLRCRSSPHAARTGRRAELPPEYVWHAQSIRMRGSLAKVHLLTDGSHGLQDGTLVVARP